MRTLIHGLFSRLGPGPDGDPGDDQLLAAFLAARDTRAFEAIVRRHGPMVHGVCRRVLGNEADADDAFQATFLVLVRANGIRSALGNWLYGVAVKVSLKDRARANRQRKNERQAAEKRLRDESPTPDSDLAVVLDQELSRLPDRYRAAVVACVLEGQSRKEAASRLGWPEGTVASRLDRGRALLAERLIRRGITTPVAGIAAVAGVTSSAVAAVPREMITRLLSGRVSAVVDGLARGVSAAAGMMRRLFLWGGVGLGAAAVTGGLIWVMRPEPVPHSAAAAGGLTPPTPSRTDGSPALLAKRNLRDELARFKGTFYVVGNPTAEGPPEKRRITIEESPDGKQLGVAFADEGTRGYTYSKWCKRDDLVTDPDGRCRLQTYNRSQGGFFRDAPPPRELGEWAVLSADGNLLEFEGGRRWVRGPIPDPK